MTKLLPSDRLFALLLLAAPTSACKLLDNYCVGDCPETTTDASATGDASASVTQASVTDFGETTDGGPHGDTDHTATQADPGDSTDSAEDTGAPDEVPTCDIIDTYPEPKTCLDGTVQPGEICYSIGAGVHEYPGGIFSALAMRLDGAGDDLLVSDVSGELTASTFAPGPGLTQTDLTQWSPDFGDPVVISGAGDFDHDGNLDFVVRVSGVDEDRIEVVLMDGAVGVKERTPLMKHPQFADPRVTDWNADGDLDLVVTGPPDGLVVMLGDGAGGFSDSPQDGYFDPLAKHELAAIDGNGVANDVVIASPDGILSVYRRTPALFIQQFDLGGEIVDIASADLDQDGHDDVAALVAGAGLNRQAVILLMRPDPDLPDILGADLRRYNVHCNATDLTLADLDADGVTDIATLSPFAPNSRVTILRNAGDGSFAERVSFQLAAPAVDLLIADLNSDGAPELIGVSGSTNTIAIAPGVP